MSVSGVREQCDPRHALPIHAGFFWWCSDMTSHRSQSQASDSEVDQLREDRQYLELKLKYVQSVNTVFRQRVSVLLRDTWGNSRSADSLPEGSNERALHQMMSELEQAEQHSPSPRSLASATADRAEYWRERFLQAMEETRPSSLKEAQTLCTLLQEKNEMTERERQFKVQYEVLHNEYQKMQDNYMRALSDKAMSAEDAVKELYKAKEAALLSTSPEQGVIAMRDSLEAARTEGHKAEQRNKVLRLRVAELRKELAAVKLASTDSLSKHAADVEQLTAATRELRAVVAERDAECRRLDAGRAIAERNVVLKDNTIVRLESRIAACEKEAEAALKEGIAAVDTNETEQLRRQIDSFELHMRDQEREAAALRATISAKNRDIDTLNEELEAMKLKAEARGKIADSYQRQIETMTVEAQQREMHLAALEQLDTRLHAAVQDLHSRQTTSELTQNLVAMNNHVAKLESMKKSLEAKTAAFKRLEQDAEALRNELVRAAKLKRPPNVDFIESDVVVKESEDDVSADDLAKLPRRGHAQEVLLRAEGSWREIRDVASGSVFYLTTDPAKTPFAPKKVVPSPKGAHTRSEPASPAPLAKPPTPRPGDSKVPGSPGPASRGQSTPSDRDGRASPASAPSAAADPPSQPVDAVAPPESPKSAPHVASTSFSEDKPAADSAPDEPTVLVPAADATPRASPGPAAEPPAATPPTFDASPDSETSLASPY